MKLIVFDLDGVLFDSISLINRMLFDIYPAMTSERIQEIFSGNFHEEIEKFKKEFPTGAMSEEEKSTYYAKYSENKSRSLLYDGVRELIASLCNDGYVLAVSTSAFAKNALPMLERAGIKEFFDFVATADTSKSKTEKFEIMKNKHEISEQDMIFITDTLGDIREAKMSGVKTVAVTWGGQEKTYLINEKSDNLVGVVDTVGELGEKVRKYLALI